MRMRAVITLQRTACIRRGSDNEYAIEGGMIDWIKTKKWFMEIRLQIFDQYVELAMECGIDKAITIYTPFHGAKDFRYLDETMAIRLPKLVAET